MKRMEIRRHTHKDVGERKHMLSQEGIEFARKLGAKMAGEYHGFHVTPLYRTSQTLAAMVEGMGSKVAMTYGPSVVDLLGAPLEEWEAIASSPAVKEHGVDLKAFMAGAMGFTIRAGENIALRISIILTGMPPGATDLAIGHSPCTEAAVYRLTGRVLKRLREGEGVVLTQDREGSITVEEIRL